MEENKEMLELMKELEKLNRRQLRTGRLQCLFSLTAAVFCAGAFVLLYQMLPQILEVLPQIGTVLEQLQTVLGNLETTTEQLAAIDLTGMVTGMDTLVTTAQQGLTETFGKLETINFETLNKAIEDLAAVVEPLSRFVKAFS